MSWDIGTMDEEGLIHKYIRSVRIRIMRSANSISKRLITTRVSSFTNSRIQINSLKCISTEQQQQHHQKPPSQLLTRPRIRHRSIYSLPGSLLKRLLQILRSCRRSFRSGYYRDWAARSGYGDCSGGVFADLVPSFFEVMGF